MTCWKHDDCLQNPDHATECPRCGSLSPCDDWQEIDIGVGVQRFDLGWSCPRCGSFAFDSDHQVIFQEEDALIEEFNAELRAMGAALLYEPDSEDEP